MRLTVVGTGYVGLTTGTCLANLGHDVVCVDVLPDRVTFINSGTVPFHEPQLAEMLRAAVDANRLRATTELAQAVQNSDIILLTVGTPDSNHGVDLSFIEAAARQIGSAMRSTSSYQVVTVKSTVVPGTTDTLVRQILEESSGKTAGQFGLCMNPEFLREGSAIADFMNPDRIVVGQWDDRSGQVLDRMYSLFDCPRIFTSLRSAEMIKYASNCLLATMISFSNEIAALCEATPETDVKVVLDGVRLDRRLSPIMDRQRIRPGILSFLEAGCGFGGSCLPKDLNALRAYARQQAITPQLLDAVVAVNANRPSTLVALVEEALGTLSSATVAVLGLAFKPNTDDVRESPALSLIRLLSDRGAAVKAYDPVVKTASDVLRRVNTLSICENARDALQGADAAIVVTAWPEFIRLDWSELCSIMRTQVIVDGRNVLSDVSWPETARYLAIGRAHRAGSRTAEVCGAAPH